MTIAVVIVAAVLYDSSSKQHVQGAVTVIGMLVFMSGFAVGQNAVAWTGYYY